MKPSRNLRMAKLNGQEQLEFLDYLKNSLASGFSLANSFSVMNIIWPKKSKIFAKLDQQMKTGLSLGKALMELGFAKTIATQIDLAVKQGNLLECLEQLTKLTRLKQEQTKKLWVELSYPFVLAGLMVFLLAFMQTFVSSQFDQTSDQTGNLLILLIFLIILFGVYYLANILNLLAKQDYKSLKKLSHYIVIGPVIRLYVHYLMMYDIGLLLASGFSLQQMCAYASQLEDGSLQAVVAQKAGKILTNGGQIETIIAKEEFLPDSLLLLIKTGSKRSTLSKRCLILAQSLFNDLTGKIQKLVVSVQPFCFIILGLCVIGMYLKLLLPMYAMMRGI